MTRRRRITALSAAVLLGSASVGSQSDTLRKQDTLSTAHANGSVQGGPLRLVADVSDRQLSIYAGTERVRTYAVAVGSPTYPTPRGTFTIRKLVWNPAWVPPDEKWAAKKTAKAPGQAGNPMKVLKIFFREPDYYIHGTGEVESLGGAASHGCIRMDPNDVAEVGRYVMEHGGQPKDESWFARVLHRRGESKVVYLQRPVPITVTN